MTEPRKTRKTRKTAGGTTGRRTHSSIDTLPAEIREQLIRMVVDNEWPAGFSGGEGAPRYEDCCEWLRSRGQTISLSALGRWAVKMRLMARLRQSSELVRTVMADLTAENAAQTQKAAAEMITAITIDFAAQNESWNASDIRQVARAMRDCGAIAIQADEYVRGQVEKKTKAADRAITELAGKKKIDPETLKAIREQVYGILS